MPECHNSIQKKVGKIASIDRGWLPVILPAHQTHKPEVGKIASIDRGWLHAPSDYPVLTLWVGKIASIDRGWLQIIPFNNKSTIKKWEK